MRISLEPGSANPNYLQIENSIKKQILRGQLRPGDQLPSIRQLARELQIAIITVKRAYDDLEQEGIVETHQGKGCFVRALNVRELDSRSQAEGLEACRQLIHRLRVQGLEIDQIQELFQQAADQEKQEREGE